MNIWIILLPALMKPPQLLTIHRLQRCSKQRVIDRVLVRCRILQVLPVLSLVLTNETAERCMASVC